MTSTLGLKGKAAANAIKARFGKRKVDGKRTRVLSRTQEYLLGVTNKQLFSDDVELEEDVENGTDEGNLEDAEEEMDESNVFKPFESCFLPLEMRYLALVAHNHMKPAMKAFIDQRKELLKKFPLVGTNTTMTMLKSVFGDDADVVYGPTFQSGPLGGDAEICAWMCRQNLGGIIFFMDPLDAHPHQCDIDTLLRLSNVHNVLMMTNPTSAHALCYVLVQALKEGRKDMIPSFFHTLESPGVKVYKEEQSRICDLSIEDTD